MNKTISMDLMGGDNGIKEAYPAVLEFAKENPDYRIIVYAVEGSTLSENNLDNVEIRFSKEFIKNDDGPMSILRKKDSTLYEALTSVSTGESSAIVAATASGPYVTGAYSLFKTLNEKVKPAFAPIFSAYDGTPKILLDSGATLDVDKNDLLNFAKLGKIFFSAIYQNDEKTSVSLVNIGVEPNKGDLLRKETYDLFVENKDLINFDGNIEPDKIMFSDSKIFVTDAFTGNILLKTLEGAMKSIGKGIKETKNGNIVTKLGLLMSKKELGKNISGSMQKGKIGGAVILGLNKIAIKAHGYSTKKEFKQALSIAKRAIDADVISKFKKEIK